MNPKIARRDIVPSKLLSLVLLVAVGTSACASGVDMGSGGPFARLRNEISAGHARIAAAKSGATTLSTTDYKNADDSVNDAYGKMIHTCKSTITGTDLQTGFIKGLKVVLPVIGSIAGGILVPYYTALNALAHKEAIAAFGGVSGVTNAAQGTISDLFPTDVLLQTRNRIAEKVNAAAEKFNKATSNHPNDRLAALDEQWAAVREALAACETFMIITPTSTPTTK